MKPIGIAIILTLILADVVFAVPFELGLTRNLPVGAGPSGVVVADFDRDGNLDIAVTQRTVDSLSVWLGNGTGKFGVPARYPTGDFPVAIAAGDIDGDGRVDLAIANSTANTVTVYHGRQFGTFGLRGDYPVGVTPTGIAIGDLNGDTHPDIAVSNFGSNTVTILVGGYGGTGVNGTSFTVPTGSGPRAVALGDFNRDGISELVTANPTAPSISVIQGKPGGFGTRTDIVTTGDPSALAVGDLTSDGWPDLLVALSGNTNVVFFRNVNGTLVVDNFLAAGSNPDAVVIAEVNGDTSPDIVIGHSTSGLVSVLQGGGNGTFAPPQDVSTDGSGILALSVADLDNDGRRDIVAPCLTPELVPVLFNNLAGPFSGIPFGLGSGRSPNPAGIAVADFDGDLRLDVAATNPSLPSITTVFNDGNANFSGNVNLPIPILPNAIVAVDLNGDAKADLAATTTQLGPSDTTFVAVFLNQGNRVFEDHTDFDRGLGVRVGLAVGDVTHDGKTDLITSHQNSAVVLAGNGLGSFALGDTLTTFTGPSTLHLADVDANGSPDLFVGGSASDGRVGAFLADGAGGFAPRVDYVLDSSVSAIVHADFDKDGKIDLAAANKVSGTISILRGNGLGGFTTVATLPVAGAPLFSLAAGDFNGDGDVDLIAGRGNAVAGILYGVGNGTFSPSVPYIVGGAQLAMEAAFLDGNATLDYAVVLDTNNGRAMIQRVRTKTTLVVTPNPSAVGQSLTYQATVTEAQPDSSNPTGTVRFFDGTTFVGSSTITGGVASLVQPGNFPWDRVLSAVYGGDNRFFGSISRPVEHFTYVPNVGAPPSFKSKPALALAAIGNPVRDGGAVRLRYEAGESGIARLTLLDVRGRVLASRKVTGTGIAELSPARRLTPGVYLVRLEQGAAQATARTVVL